MRRKWEKSWCCYNFMNEHLFIHDKRYTTQRERLLHFNFKASKLNRTFNLMSIIAQKPITSSTNLAVIL